MKTLYNLVSRAIHDGDFLYTEYTKVYFHYKEGVRWSKMYSNRLYYIQDSKVDGWYFIAEMRLMPRARGGHVYSPDGYIGSPLLLSKESQKSVLARIVGVK